MKQKQTKKPQTVKLTMNKLKGGAKESKTMNAKSK